MVAAVVPGDNIDATRKRVRSLLLPYQCRLRMKGESDPRRRVILSEFARYGVQATIYDAGKRGTQLERRYACLRALMEDVVRNNYRRVVLERDTSLVQRDRAAILEYTRAKRCHPAFSYTHSEAHEELLLCLPDAIAWAWAKGGDWRRRIKPVRQL